MARYYTYIKGDIQEVKILSETNLVYKIEYADFFTGSCVSFRVKREVFTNKEKAKRYFK
jgi:hypothetical protein